MKIFLIFGAGAIVGGIASIILASGIFTGIGAGVGIATGMQDGACLAVEAAKDQDMITAEQVDEVLNAAARLIASDEYGAAADSTGGNVECEKIVAGLKAAAAKKSE